MTYKQPEDYLITSDRDIAVPAGFRIIAEARIGYLWAAPHVDHNELLNQLSRGRTSNGK